MADDSHPTPLQKLQQQQKAQNESTANSVDQPFKLAPFNPSSEQIQEKALELLKLKEGDVLFDLGCGDGRLLCHAVECHANIKCIGIEIDPVFVERAQERIQRLLPSLQSRIEVRLEDALKVMEAAEKEEQDGGGESIQKDSTQKPLSELTLLDDATALYLFVLPKGIQKLMPILNALMERRKKEGRHFRLLSYMFKIHDWEPTTVDRTAKGGCPIYYYEWNGAAAKS